MWLQEEVPWRGQSSDGPSAHGWATKWGQEGSWPRAVPSFSCPEIHTRLLLSCRCCCREVWRAALELLGALLWVGLCCPRCPACVCVLGTEQAVCGDGQQCGDTCMWSGLLRFAGPCLQDEG